jgi:hypothetical protein
MCRGWAEWVKWQGCDSFDAQEYPVLGLYVDHTAQDMPEDDRLDFLCYIYVERALWRQAQVHRRKRLAAELRYILQRTYIDNQRPGPFNTAMLYRLWSVVQHEPLYPVERF